MKTCLMIIFSLDFSSKSKRQEDISFKDKFLFVLLAVLSIHGAIFPILHLLRFLKTLQSHQKVERQLYDWPTFQAHYCFNEIFSRFFLTFLHTFKVRVSETSSDFLMCIKWRTFPPDAVARKLTFSPKKVWKNIRWGTLR